MLIKKILCIALLCLTMATISAVTPSDAKYCTMLKQLQPKMNIGDVFLLMGPPHSFGQPPNLDMQAVNSAKQVMQPQSDISQDTQGSHARLLKSIAADPILGAFMQAPADSSNVLIWNFENNSLSVSVKVKGPTVTDVQANFSCK